MNWILSILFLIIVYTVYYGLGDLVLDIFGYKKTNAMRFIAGFLMLFFFQFVIGVPCQLLHLSWTIYFVLQSIVFLMIIALLVYRNKSKLKNVTQLISKENLIEFAKNNWVFIVFVLLFTTFAIANQLPYYSMNYDDTYYIGKVANLQGANHLMNENYFNGRLLNGASVGVERLLNAYELAYAYFASVFHIGVPFFCRATMSCHNYILFTFVYKQFASCVIKDKKYVQYTILPFFIFLIPYGYLQSGLRIEPWKIVSYDLWQFQTAAYYGSSVVRMMSLPILYIFSEPLLEKMELKKIIYIGLLSFTFISFSTVYVQDLFVFFIFILIIKFYHLLKVAFRNKDKKNMVIYTLCIILIGLALIASRYLDRLSFINTQVFSDNVGSYIVHYNSWVLKDSILAIAPFILVSGLMFVKDDFQKYPFVLTTLLYLFIITLKFVNILVLSSFNTFFVILRTIASIQYLVVSLGGVLFVYLFERMNKKKLILTVISVCMILGIPTYFVKHRSTIQAQVYLGSGISKYGWSFKRLFSFNEQMTPDIFVKVGNYFNTLEYGNYKMYTPPLVKTDGKNTYDGGFLMTTNRIQLATNNGFDNIVDSEFEYLIKFCNKGVGTYEEVLSILQKDDVHYLLVLNENAKKTLEESGVTLVLEDTENEDPYYLFKFN